MLFPVHIHLSLLGYWYTHRYVKTRRTLCSDEGSGRVAQACQHFCASKLGYNSIVLEVFRELLEAIPMLPRKLEVVGNPLGGNVGL